MVARKLDIQKKQHRERGQLAHRTRLGLLEKRKDYLLRARDYKSKQARLLVLKRKASEKNKDEFYFGMIRSRTNRGVHVSDRGNKSLDTDLVKILKNQDAAYVRTQCSIEANRVEKLRHELGSRVDITGQPISTLDPTRKHILRLLQQDYSAVGANSALPLDAVNDSNDLDSSIVPRKTIFVDSVQKVQTFKPKRSKQNNDQVTSQANSRSKPSSSSPDPEMLSILDTFKSRITRLRTLQHASSELALTQSLMSNGSKRLLNKNKNKNKNKKSSSASGVVVWNGRNENWFDKLDMKEQREEEDKREAEERQQKGIKTGAKVWKWKAQRKKIIWPCFLQNF